jgi:curli biogenesis system outer membrane secretion channel CsgG
MNGRIRRASLVLVLGVVFSPVVVSATTAANPSVAVMPIAAEGIAPTGAGSLDAGKAMTDILTNKLVDTGKLSVVDRQNIEKVFAEQKLSQSADFSTADAVALGRVVGANYLLVGRITFLDKIRSNNAASGFLNAAGLGGIVGSSDTYRIAVNLQLLDSDTGRIVKGFTYEGTRAAQGLSIGDPTGTTSGGYSSQSFANSVVGGLMSAAAGDLADRIAATPLAASASVPGIAASIINVDGGVAILNKGSAAGVTVGMFFNVFRVVQSRDPETGSMLSTRVPDGTIQVTSVETASSVARVVSGKPDVGNVALGH